MNDFRADLHCHTTCSDGSLSPKEIILLAKNNGLQGLSITDHDSINAYEQAIPEANKEGIQLISGVEFSALHNDVNVHILGYSFALNNPSIQEFCLKHAQRRQERNQGILDKLAALNMPVSEAEMLASTSLFPQSKRTIGRPHIALAMIKKGYVESIQEAFKKFLAEDRPCYVRGKSFSAQETINIIHQAKGFAVIAHPHLIKEHSIIQQLLQCNFDGIECYYGKFLGDQHTRWVKLANKKGWLITGGSDFHGDIKPNLDLGCSWIGKEAFNILENRFKENN